MPIGNSFPLSDQNISIGLNLNNSLDPPVLGNLTSDSENLTISHAITLLEQGNDSAKAESVGNKSVLYHSKEINQSFNNIIHNNHNPQSDAVLYNRGAPISPQGKILGILNKERLYEAREGKNLLNVILLEEATPEQVLEAHKENTIIFQDQKGEIGLHSENSMANEIMGKNISHIAIHKKNGEVEILVVNISENDPPFDH